MNTSYCDLRVKAEVRAVDRLRLALTESQDTKGVNDGRLSRNMGGQRVDKEPYAIPGVVLGLVRADK